MNTATGKLDRVGSTYVKIDPARMIAYDVVQVGALGDVHFGNFELLRIVVESGPSSLRT